MNISGVVISAHGETGIGLDIKVDNDLWVFYPVNLSSILNKYCGYIVSPTQIVYHVLNKSVEGTRINLWLRKVRKDCKN